MLATGLLVAGLVLVLDQASKALVVRGLAEGQAAAVAGLPLRIVRLSNARLGLGLLPRGRAGLLLWSAVMVGLGLVVLATPLLADADPVAPLGLGAALGGASGNALDRLRLGAVTDFIDLRVWPVFNLADLAIVFGTVVALWGLA